MARFAALVVVGLLALFTSAEAEPDWSTLRVTWGVNVLKSNIFAKMPMTKSDAENEKFAQFPESTQCASGKFLGERYFKNYDPSIILLYDKNGYIAGMQTAFPKNRIPDGPVNAWFRNQSAFFQEDTVDGKDAYTLTVYFVDPAIICKDGRTKSEFKASKSGNRVYIQNGPNPLVNTMKVPTYEDDTKNTNWSKEKCFVTIGRHYFYKSSKDMNCDETIPIFLLYNRGKLTGFGFAAFGRFLSDRYEHIEQDQLKNLFDPVPSCLYKKFNETQGITSMHVFFNVNPWNLAC